MLLWVVRNMRRLLHALALAIAFLPAAAHAERRVALVMGNAAYASVARLANPYNDAEAIGAMLREAGFETVDIHRDLDRAGMVKALRLFETKVKDAEIGVIFYAGHGVEIGGQNYLLPVDTKLATDRDAEDEAISLDRVLRAVDGASRLRLVILDACRDNPFLARMTRTFGNRSSAGRGLAQTEAPSSDMLIAYAAKAGTTAEDADGSNSPFTKALVRHLATPGLDIRLALGRVRDDVLKATSRRQEPHVYGSLGGTALPLSNKLAALASPPPRHDGPEASATEQAAAYSQAERIGTDASWNAFLARYPAGFHADLARAALAKLASASTRSGVEPSSSSDPQECDRLAAGRHDTDRPRSVGGVPFDRIDPARAVPACRRAVEAEPNVARLTYQLGRALSAEKDHAGALRYNRKAAELGSAAALNSIGVAYEFGNGVGKDEGQAAAHYHKAAELGNADALNNLGVMYWNGRGVARDDEEAVRLYRKAADLDHAAALNNLGFANQIGRGTAQNDEEAIRLYRAAIYLQFHPAFGNLGWMYENGRGVPQNYAEALRLYRRGADLGNARAMNELGQMYQNGRGVTRDDNEAVRLYRAAAELKYASALNNLGWMYSAGRGVSQNYAEALRLYKASIDLGNNTAMRNLAIMYENGRGVARDLAEAGKWYAAAARAGNKSAQADLERLKIKP